MKSNKTLQNNDKWIKIKYLRQAYFLENQMYGKIRSLVLE